MAGCMLHERQLSWVVRNRQTRSRTQPVGVAAARVLERMARSPDRGRAAIAEVVADVVDSEFLRNCDLGAVHCGVLTVLVHDERLIQIYRLRWAMDLLERLRQSCPRSGVRRVQFVKGDRSGGRRLGRDEGEVDQGDEAFRR